MLANNKAKALLLIKIYKKIKYIKRKKLDAFVDDFSLKFLSPPPAPPGEQAFSFRAVLCKRRDKVTSSKAFATFNKITLIN